MQLSGRRMIDRREQALATIHTALDAGITLLDTANILRPGCCADPGWRGSLWRSGFVVHRAPAGDRHEGRHRAGPRHRRGCVGPRRHTDALCGRRRPRRRLGAPPDLYSSTVPILGHSSNQIAGLMAVSNAACPADRAQQRDLADGADGSRDRRWTCRPASSPSEQAVPAISDGQRRPGSLHRAWDRLSAVVPSGAETFADHAHARGVTPQQLTLA